MTPPRLSIAFISAGALAYEVLLMRLFSVIQWYHFAYMIISLALLGYGASGTFLSLARDRLLPRFKPVYLINLLLFAVSAVACFLIVQQLPFNPYEVLWDPEQPLWLLLIYLLLALPFFFAANCIGLAFSRFTADVPHLYAADLLGAGAGSIAIVGLLFLAFPSSALLALGSLIALAALVAGLELGLRSRRLLSLLAMMVMLPWLLPANWTQPVISPYKGLSQLLQVSGTRIIEQRSSPLGLLTVVESPRIPLRHAPGLSLQSPQAPPEQLAVFTDGEAMTTITRDTGDRHQLAYLDYLPSALPYHLEKPRNVLILGAGGGSDVLQARYFRVPQIDAVELNPQLVDLVQTDYAGFDGNVYATPGIKVHIAEARGFVSASPDRYDLIQLSLLDSFSASSAGLYAMSESYLYTVEALRQYLGKLRPDGYLAISRWVKLPPRDTLKLFATAISALESLSVSQPEQRLILIRGWQTSTLLIKNGVFTQAEIKILRRFCQQRAFDLVYYPGIRAEEANHYNILQQPYFFTGTRALLGEQRNTFLDNYKFQLFPATDDKPYFFNFFKWRILPEVLSLRGQGGLPLLGMGYLIVVATLVQAVVTSFFLILLPLMALRRNHSQLKHGNSHWRNLVYFFALGLAFLFIEIAFIQKFILFLHHPLYAVSIVLASFLLFAGLGSAFANRFARRGHSRTAITGSIFGIVVFGLTYIIGLEPLFNNLMGISTLLKILLAVGLIAPLAFCMGIPFPLGMTRLGQSAPYLIPWVWGVNGCASVISAVLATLLAIQFGFNVVIVFALGIYILAARLVPAGQTKS